MRPDDVSNQWPSASLLGRLTVKARQKLLTTGIRRHFRAGDVLLNQGDEGTHSLLIMSGTTKVTALDESGDEALLAIRVGGDLVGETAILQGVRRTATITACSDVVARQLTGVEFTEFVASYPDASRELTNMVLTRLQWSNQRRVDFGRSALVRLSGVLIELTSTYGKRVQEGWTLGVPLTQSELGSLAGMKLPTVEKLLSQLEKEGVVRRQYRQVIVAEPERLKEISEQSSRNP